MDNTITKRPQPQQMVNQNRQTLNNMIRQMAPGIRKALPSAITPERFTRIVFSALSANPTLYEVTPQSFIGAMMTAAQLGLEPNTPLGQAYLIPYRNHGQMECQFQLGYRGMIELAYRSGHIKTIQAQTVYANDRFEYELGLDPKLMHVPAMTNRGPAVAYYATFRTTDGGFGFDVLSRDDAEQHAKRYSKSYNNSKSPWATNFDEMAKKTVLKRVLKYAPLGSEFVQSINADESVCNISPDTAAAEDAPDVVLESTAAEVEVDPATGEVLSENDEQLRI